MALHKRRGERKKKSARPSRLVISFLPAVLPAAARGTLHSFNHPQTTTTIWTSFKTWRATIFPFPPAVVQTNNLDYIKTDSSRFHLTLPHFPRISMRINFGWGSSFVRLETFWNRFKTRLYSLIFDSPLIREIFFLEKSSLHPFDSIDSRNFIFNDPQKLLLNISTVEIEPRTRARDRREPDAPRWFVRLERGHDRSTIVLRPADDAARLSFETRESTTGNRLIRGTNEVSLESATRRLPAPGNPCYSARDFDPWPNAHRKPANSSGWKDEAE